MKKTLSLILLLVTIAPAAWGYRADYAPFEPGAAPKPFPVTELKKLASESSDSQCTFAERPNSSPRIVFSWTPTDKRGDCTISVIRPNGTKILTGATIQASSPKFITAVYSVLLNEDDKPDYVISEWSGGCGLAAEWCFLTFLLSNGDGYSVTQTSCMDCGKEDFVDLNKDGRAEFIHTSFVDGDSGKDGKYHNYWVFNILQFKGTQIVSANPLDHRFPGWVSYKFKPNHQNTDQLTPEQRMRCWREAWTRWGGDPLMLGLEKEQGRTP